MSSNFGYKTCTFIRQVNNTQVTLIACSAEHLIIYFLYALSSSLKETSILQVFADL